MNEERKDKCDDRIKIVNGNVSLLSHERNRELER